MRTMLAPALAAALLTACEQSEPKADTAMPEPTPAAALTYDGADAKDRAALLAHGERLSWVLGCTGCHKPDLQGDLFTKEMPQLGKLYATNLTRVLPQYSDAALEKLLREGTHPERGDLWIMPSEVLQRLSGPDMTALIAHLRTVQPAGEPTPPPALSDEAKKLIASGKLRPVAKWVAQYKTQVPADLGEQHAWGRYMASISCAECHGGDLTGIPDFEPGLPTPDLDIAGTYSPAELNRLLTTGEGKTRKELRLMSMVGKEHFSKLTQRERDAIIGYLLARANRPQ